MTLVRKSAAFGLAGLVSFAITAFGQLLWQPLVIANLRFHPEIPWAPVLMAGLLAALLLYLSGRGWPVSTSATRRRLFRWNPISWPTFFLAIGSGLFGLAAFGGLLIAVSDVVHIPAGIQPAMSGVPLATAIAFLIMSAMAAPLSEEAAFRGYAMGLLERAWGSGLAAIVGSSILFGAAHFLQGLDPVKLSLYVAAGLLFATTAYLTNSLYAAMVVHGIGDLLGFTVLWPHDQRPHGMGFADPMFAPALAALVVFGPLAIMAFRKLAKVAAPLRARPDRSLMPVGIAA